MRISDWSSDVCSSDLLDIIARRQITSLCAPPTLYRQLVLADFAAHDLSGLRHCTSAGEPLNPAVIRTWRDGTGGLPLCDGYGTAASTESGSTSRRERVCPYVLISRVPVSLTKKTHKNYMT